MRHLNMALITTALVLTACGKKDSSDSATGGTDGTGECSTSVPADCDATDPSTADIDCETSGMGPMACTITCYCCDSTVTISQCALGKCASSPEECEDRCANPSPFGEPPEEPEDTYTGSFCFDPR